MLNLIRYEKEKEVLTLETEEGIIFIYINEEKQLRVYNIDTEKELIK